MEPKFNMTVEQNIFVAKRNIVDYIWKSANLEGIAVTYPETDTIYNGISVPHLRIDDVIAINNLKYAWRFVLENTNYPTDYPFICKINQYVGGENLIYNAGFLRNIPVKMGGTAWIPDIPAETQVRKELDDIKRIPNPTDRGITLMLYCMRKQMFVDGNKRTAMLAGNHIMISNGAGIISIPMEAQDKFKSLLVKFYETNDMEEIKLFVYDNCIDGIDFETADKKDNEIDN
ncbi:MAG: Fic family protein [Eubacterium sp.]|jgi:hypothetical protein|nr:Fic family protein [Eubacterium sp.]